MADPASPRYTFAFAGIHRNDLTTKSTAPVRAIASLVFYSGKDVYHIQIPLCIGTPNPFLRCWMDSTEKESSFSINQLLSSPKLEFDIYKYTQTYNRTATTISASKTGISPFTGKYILCLMKTPQFVLDGEMLTRNDLPTFTSLFNFAMYDLFGISHPIYPLQLGSDLYMETGIATKHPKATFYRITGTDVSKTVEGFENRLLNDVKCYPIDLATQVDSAGAITVDEDTLKPVDVRPQMTIDVAPSAPSVNINVTTWIIVGVIFVVGLLIILGFLYWALQPKATVSGGVIDTTPVASGGTPVAGASGGTPVAGAPVATPPVAGAPVAAPPGAGATPGATPVAAGAPVATPVATTPVSVATP